MIIYGTRMYGAKEIVFGWGNCGNCGKYGRLKSYTARKWGHLYFIPLIPDGPHVRVISECPKCNTGAHVPVTEVPAAKTNLEANYKQALEALAEGKTEITLPNNEEPAKISLILANNADYALCLGAKDMVDDALKVTGDGSHTVEFLMLQAAVHEFNGRSADAIANYQQLSAADPEDLAPLILMASLQRNTGNPEAAARTLENAEMLAVEDLGLKQMLIDIYEELKDFTKVVTTYENAFLILPDLTEDKAVVKKYKKACKKAKRTSVIA